MKLLLLLFSLFLSGSSEQDTTEIFYSDYFQNFYSSELFFPDAIAEDTVIYTFCDSLFIGYEKLRNLEPFNELQGDLFDFFYYNFDIIDSRYRYKNVFENRPPDETQWDSIKLLDNRQPCDSVVFELTPDHFYTWFPCLTPPFKVYDGIYSSYEDYVEKHKPYMRIYNLGNVPVRRGIEGKLILIEAKYTKEDFEYLPYHWDYYRRIYLITSIKKKIKSVTCLSEYVETLTDEVSYFYTDIRLVKDGLFLSKTAYPEVYRKKIWEDRKALVPDPEYYLFWINKEGYHVEIDDVEFYPE